MSLTEHLSNESWENILQVIDMHLPQPFHKNKYSALKDVDMSSLIEYLYCPSCERIFKYDQKPQSFNCECNTLIEKERLKLEHKIFYYIPLKGQLIKMLNNPLLDLLRQQCQECDVINGAAYKQLKVLKIISPNDLSIQYNTDGLKLT